MLKTVIFVEGQTELIFVREFLAKKFNYSVDIKCNALISHEYTYAEHDYPCSGAEKHFWIINVCNDEAVLNELLARESKLYELGYSKIIGLRDMYSSRYKKYSNFIDIKIIEDFIKGSDESIKSTACNPANIVFLFSIMEIESWILAFDNFFEKIHSDLTNAKIKAEIGLDLDDDPENSVFHPANVLDKILSITGGTYNKSKHGIESFVSKIENEDHDQLYVKPVCNSYNAFYDCFK